MAGARDLLEVVEDEERRGSAEAIEKRFAERSLGIGPHIEADADRRDDEIRVAERREVDEPGATREPISDALGDFEREAGLATPSGPSQGKKACLFDKPGQLGELSLTTDERGELRRQVARRPRERPFG